MPNYTKVAIHHEQYGNIVSDSRGLRNQILKSDMSSSYPLQRFWITTYIFWVDDMQTNIMYASKCQYFLFG